MYIIFFYLARLGSFAWCVHCINHNWTAKVHLTCCWSGYYYYTNKICLKKNKPKSLSQRPTWYFKCFIYKVYSILKQIGALVYGPFFQNRTYIYIYMYKQPKCVKLHRRLFWWHYTCVLQKKVWAKKD